MSDEMDLHHRWLMLAIVDELGTDGDDEVVGILRLSSQPPDSGNSTQLSIFAAQASGNVD